MQQKILAQFKKFRFIAFLTIFLSLSSIGVVHADLNISEEKEQESQPNIVFLGASNTNTQFTPENHKSWVERLPDYGSPWNVSNLINRAASGNGLENYYGLARVKQITADITDQNPDYIVFNLGAIDFVSGRFGREGIFYPPIEFELRYNWVLDKILEQDENNKIKLIFLMNLIWAPILDTGTPNDAADFNRYQEIIAIISSTRNYPLIEIFPIFENKIALFSDNRHYTDEGHILVAAEVNKIAGAAIMEDYFLTETTTGDLSNISTSTTTSSETSANVSFQPIILFSTMIVVFVILGLRRKYAK